MQDEKKTETQLLAEIKELRKQVAEAEETAEERSRNLEFYRAIALYTYHWDYWVSPAKEYVYMSPSCERISGYSVDEFMKDPELMNHIIHPDDRNLVSLSIDEELKANHPQGIDFRIITKDGKERWISHVCQPIPDDTTRSLGIRASNRDITKRKQAEKEIQDLLETTTEGFIQVDNDIKIQRVNPSMCQILGRKEEDTINHDFLEFVADESVEMVQHQLRQREKGETGSYEIAFTRPNGSKIFCLINATPIYDVRNKKSGSVGLLTDLTERKQLEFDLRNAKIQAEAASLAKTQFLSNMSHEIRSPLNSIVGFSQILSKQARQLILPDDFLHYLANIKTSGRNLSELINNILDLSKIEAGKMFLSLEDINLKLLIQGIFHINKAQALEKDIDFKYEFDPQLPEFVFSDRTFVHQILMNLVSNAIKFTPERKAVVLRAKRERNSILLEVEDEGIGIPKKLYNQIFGAFEQIDVSMTRQYGGTGLGLAIVRKMTELLKGEIKLESEEERGSRFSITIPLVDARSQSNESEEFQWEDIRFSPENKVLLVEDEATNQEMIEVLFRELGIKIELADNGKTGIEKVIALKPDLILMDIHMPGMDGMEATRCIRLLREGKEIPIVALSADAFTGQQKTALQAGVSEYLTKPLDFKKLMPILSKYLKPDKSADSSTSEALTLHPLPESVEKQLLEEYSILADIPPYDAKEIKRQMNKMMAMCRGFDSPHCQKLNEILAASVSRNSQKIPQLIKDILHG